MMASSGVHSSASSSAVSSAIRTWVAATASSAIEAARRHSRLVSSTYWARRRRAPISWSGRRGFQPASVVHLRLLGLFLDHRRQGDQRPGAHRVAHRRGNADLAEVPVQRLLDREAES